MAKSYGRLLRWGAAAAVTALAVWLVLRSPVPLLGPEGGPLVHGDLLVPMATGLVLILLLTRRRHNATLKERTRLALEGHSMPYELSWLLVLLALFLLATLGGSVFAELLLPTVSWEVMMPPIRILFLFVVPLIVVDLGGFTVAGYSTKMPLLAMRVTEGWRWAGLVPVAAVLGLMVLAVFPVAWPDAAVVLAAAVAIVAAVAIPEEMFFRALLQTRLERITGRWAGVLLSTVLFVLASVYLSEFGDFSPETETIELGVLQAAVFYTGVGLLQGCLWASYRNIWLNVLLRSGIVLLRVAPTLQFL